MFKTAKEIEERKIELRGLIKTEGCDLDAIEKELEGLETEKRAIEKRQEIIKKLGNGTIVGNEISKPEFQGESRGAKTFEPETMEKEDLYASAEYRSAFLKKLQGAELNEVEKRAITTINNSAVIPTLTLNKIIEKLKQISVIYPLVTCFNIPSAFTIPVEDVVGDASWIDEGVASTDSDDKTSEVSLVAFKLIKTVTISVEAKVMSISAFEDYIVTQLGNKIKIAVDTAILKGTGVKQAKGILTSITAIQTAATTGFDYDDIADILKSIGSLYAQGAVFVMSRTTLYDQIAKIKDSQKRPIFIMDASDGFEGKIMGRPVICYDAMTDDTIIFGNFTYYFFNWVKAFEISKDDSVEFRSGSTVYRALGLADGKVALTEAFVVQKLKTATGS